MRLNTKDITDKLNTFYKEYNKTFQSYAEISRTDYLKTLPAGAKVPSEVKLYTDESKAKFKDYSKKATAEINSYIDDCMQEIYKLKTNAPTVEAVNYISMLNRLDKPQVDLIDMAMTRYGDNYITYTALFDIAKSNKYYDFKQNPLDIIEKDLKDEQYRISGIEYQITTNGADTQGKLAWDMMQRTLPEYDSYSINTFEE